MSRDTALVQRAVRGEREAFGELYEIYSADMYHFALSICKNPWDAQDAVQETAISVYRSIGSLKNPEKFKAYLFSALSNTCKKRLSDKPRETEYENSGQADSRLEFDLPVREALEMLDGVSREIVMLSLVAGFKSKEIGKMLNLPSATVRTKQKRALERLRKELAE